MKEIQIYLFSFIALLSLGLSFGFDLNAPCRNATGDVNFFPHPNYQECVKYISCWQGTGFEVPCPDGAWFDRCENICNWPDSIEDKCKCSDCPSSGISFFPNTKIENQCHLYMMCVNGNSFDMSCGNGLLFDRQRQVCADYRTVTDCVIDTCKNISTLEVGYAPNLQNCQQFFICARGNRLMTQTCPSGQGYSMTETSEIGGVTFYGGCSRSPFECFNGQNWRGVYVPETTTQPGETTTDPEGGPATTTEGDLDSTTTDPEATTTLDSGNTTTVEPGNTTTVNPEETTTETTSLDSNGGPGGDGQRDPDDDY